MAAVTVGSEWLPPCVQVSSSPMVTWEWGPSLAQQSSTSYASLVCVESSPDRCVCEAMQLTAAAATFCLFINCRMHIHLKFCFFVKLLKRTKLGRRGGLELFIFLEHSNKSSTNQ